MKKLKRLIDKLKQSKGRMAFIALGILSTIWFLFRVIPKPSRAAYPCIRAAAPIMSSFVIWIISTGSLVLLSKSFAASLAKNKFRTALALLLPLILVGFFTLSNNSLPSFAAQNPPPDPVHPSLQPFGEAQGVLPGRVTWFHCPDATNQMSGNYTNGFGLVDHLDDVYYQAKNNDSIFIQQMMDSSIVNLTGAASVKSAWEAIFKHFNQKVYGNNNSYTTGEKIFIKTNNQGFGFKENMNPDLTQRDESAHGNFPPHGLGTSPYSVISTIRQLVVELGVPEQDIYVGDPHQNFNNIYYDLLRNAFPDIHIMGVNSGEVVDCESYGRTLSVPSASDVIFYSDAQGLSDKLYQQILDAKYMINIAGLKAHRGGGITLFAKNHFGSHTRDDAMHLHPSIPQNVEGYNNYRVFVDLMAHKDLGGKTIIFIIDALWGSSPCELDKPRKWDMAPFNGDWTSSIFMSLDPVAISSVGFDFLRTEYTNAIWWNEKNSKNEAYPNKFDGVDDYLHQAASESNWPSGLVYDPEDDGIKVSSLGVHEHWNNATDMEYSRNLNPEAGGIELVKLHNSISLPGKPSSVVDAAIETTPEITINLYPNPAREQINISLSGNFEGKVDIDIYDLGGKVVKSVSPIKTSYSFEEVIFVSDLTAGVYSISVRQGNKQFTRKLIIRRD